MWHFILLTLVALGILQACLYKSFEARCVLLITKSRDGPISSNSTLGVGWPDFLSKILQAEVSVTG